MTIHQLHTKGLPETWADRLDEARSESEVVSLARDFVARFGPDELARLPERCRPSRIVDAEDIAEYAMTLVRCELEAQGSDRGVLTRMATFFSAASSRLSEVSTSAGGNARSA
jgi:hypothetical protein